MSFAQVNGITIHYTLEGIGESTVVLINGLADDMDAWAFQVEPLLSVGMRVLRFDNRGAGRSDKPVGPYTARLMAADTKAMVDHHDLGMVHLVGVSMGGLIAQEYALAWPDDLQTLTLACTYAAPDPYTLRHLDLWSQLAKARYDLLPADIMLRLFTPQFFEQRPEELHGIEQMLQAAETQPVEAFLAQLAVLAQHDAVDRLLHLYVPTLILAGLRDTYTPPGLTERLAGVIPGARWATLPSGHGCLAEDADLFNQKLIDFLKTSVPRVVRPARTGAVDVSESPRFGPR
jgi:3-oxoadipate enol-lactonase